MCIAVLSSRDCNVAVCMQGAMNELRSLREARDALDDQIQRMQWGLGPCPPTHPDTIATPSASRQAPFADVPSSRLLSTSLPTAHCMHKSKVHFLVLVVTSVPGSVSCSISTWRHFSWHQYT